MKIGILTSGGDCQGLNSALRGVAKSLFIHFRKEVEILVYICKKNKTDKVKKCKGG